MLAGYERLRLSNKILKLYSINAILEPVYWRSWMVDMYWTHSQRGLGTGTLASRASE